MKIFLAAALLSGLSIAATSAAHAQTGPAFPTTGQGTSEANARRNTGVNAEELARNQRRAAMTPDQIKQDQQMELLQARTGNTSFGRGGGPERQFDSNRSGNGFIVRKYRAKKGFADLKRGTTHAVGSSNPKGKPLVHKSKMRKRFLLF
ncbi:hypothetical protein AUC43_05245 [Hymenobacter sedentarius]|uniref:Uncharacterized protein n=1 Tax=Hymenobacter sedentarius TaxID=1411621 RepID=A0A0U4AUZ0_9BACT|nr:hypothetical protein [Hymenobacter sedentarius]ALW84541.1 hypothetical protein AUC43_05245 [Hymenobacter sedentarius]